MLNAYARGKRTLTYSVHMVVGLVDRTETNVSQREKI